MRKRRKKPLKSVSIGSHIHDVFENSPKASGIWHFFPDTIIHVVVQCSTKRGSSLFGLCYQPHSGSPLDTKVRVKFLDGEKWVLEIPSKTPGEAEEAFVELLSDFTSTGNAVGGEVLTPSMNRSEYETYCRIIHCQPLPGEQKLDF